MVTVIWTGAIVSTTGCILALLMTALVGSTEVGLKGNGVLEKKGGGTGNDHVHALGPGIVGKTIATLLLRCSCRTTLITGGVMRTFRGVVLNAMIGSGEVIMMRVRVEAAGSMEVTVGSFEMIAVEGGVAAAAGMSIGAILCHVPPPVVGDADNVFKNRRIGSFCMTHPRLF